MEDKMIFYGKMLVIFQLLLLAATLSVNFFCDRQLQRDGINLYELLEK